MEGIIEISANGTVLLAGGIIAPYQPVTEAKLCFLLMFITIAHLRSVALELKLNSITAAAAALCLPRLQQLLLAVVVLLFNS